MDTREDIVKRNKRCIEVCLKYLRMARDINDDKKLYRKLVELIKEDDKERKFDTVEGGSVSAILIFLRENRNFRKALVDMLNEALDENLKTLEDFDSSEAELETLAAIPK